MNSDINGRLAKCWLYNGCPCVSGACYGLPDDGCPVYRWFRKIINETDNSWISIEDKLPSDFASYLVTDGEDYAVGHYRPDANAWDNFRFGWVEGRDEDPPYGLNKVTHWRPLPGLPNID